jgi:hypothetical protein
METFCAVICLNGRFRAEEISMSKELKSEFEVPPHTKVRVVAMVDKKLYEEMEHIHKLEIEQAKTEDRTEPDWSNTLEMLMKKGVREYR